MLGSNSESEPQPQTPTVLPAKVVPAQSKAPTPKVTAPTGYQLVQDKQVTKQADDLLMRLDKEYGPTITEEPITEDERGQISKFFSGVGDAFVQTSRDVLVAKRQLLGQDIKDISEPITNNPNYTITEGLGYSLTKYGGAAIAGAAAGSAIFPGVGTLIGGIAGPAIAVFGEDPRTLNIADVIKMAEQDINESLNGTVFEDLDPVIEGVGDLLAKEEGDTIFVQRLKNLGSDVATGVVVAPAVKMGKYAVGKVLQKTGIFSEKIIQKISQNTGVPENEVIKKANKEQIDTATKEVIEEVQPEAIVKDEAGEQVIKAGEGARVGKITLKEPSIITASKNPEVPVDETTLQNFEKSLAQELPPSQVKGDIVPDNVKIDINDENIVDKIGNLASIARDKFRELRVLTPVNFKDILNKARKTITPKDKARILNEGATSLDDVAKLVVVFEEAAESAAVKLADTSVDTEAKALAKAEAMNNLMYIAGVYSNTYTEIARKLGFGKMLDKLGQAGDPNAINFIGTVGKYKAVNNLIAKHGGLEKIQNMGELFKEVMIHSTDVNDVLSTQANKLVSEGQLTKETFDTLIQNSKKILAESNAAYFMDKAGDVAKKSRGRTIQEGIVNYLSSNALTFNSFKNALVEFPATFLLLKAPSNYMKSIGWKIAGNPIEAKATLGEANAYVVSFFSELKDAFRKGKQAIVEGKPDPNERFIKGPEAMPADVAYNADAGMPFEIAVKKGTMMDHLKSTYGWSIGLNRRLLIGADVGISHIAYESHVKSKAVYFATQQGLTGEGFEKAVNGFIKNPPDGVHDAAVLESRKFAYNAEPEFFINRAIEKGLGEAPLLRAFNLFFRARANSMERALEYFPGAGFLLDGQMTLLKEAVKTGNKSILQDVFAKQATGAMMLGTAYMIYDLGYADPVRPKGMSTFKYWSPNYAKSMSEGEDPGAINLPSGSKVKAPPGSPFEKFMKIGGLFHFINNRDTDNAAVESTAEFLIGAISALMDDPGRYQSDLEFMMSLVNLEATKQDAGRFISGKAMQFFPLAPSAAQLSQAWSGPYMKDLQGEGTTTLDFIISSLENRANQIIDADGLVNRRNVFGEPIFKTHSGMGFSIFNTPIRGEDATMEKLMALEEYTLINESKGISRLDTRLPNRNIILDLDAVTKMPVQLPVNLYEKLMDYYAGVDNLTGLSFTGVTLRDLVSQRVDNLWENYKSNKDTEVLNLGITEIKSLFSNAKQSALDALKTDPEYIRWATDTIKTMAENRDKVPKLEQKRTDTKVKAIQIRSR